MKTLKLKDGECHYSQSRRVVLLAKKWLAEYLADGKERKPGQLEDDLVGGTPLCDVMMGDPLYSWRGSPFFPALAMLVDEGSVTFRTDRAGNVLYRRSKNPSNTAAVGRRDSDVPTSGLLADESKGETR